MDGAAFFAEAGFSVADEISVSLDKFRFESVWLLFLCVCVFAGKEWSKLGRQVRLSQQSAYMAGTMQNLTIQWRAYFLCCGYFSLVPVPATLDTVYHFAQFLSRSFKSWGQSETISMG